MTRPYSGGVALCVTILYTAVCYDIIPHKWDGSCFTSTFRLNIRKKYNFIIFFFLFVKL